LHNVQTNIKLVEKVFEIKTEDEPPLEFNLSDTDESYGAQYLNAINLTDTDFVVGFHPGCATLKNHIKRRWEPEKFAALAKHLIEKDKAKILIFGGPEEDELKENIAALINSENAHVVKTKNLTTSAAVMKRCNIFVTNDSSLMHIASALGLNVVAVIGPTSRFYIHPWKTDYRIVSLNLSCSPCFFYSPKPLKCYRDDVHFKCIKEINVKMVYSAIKDIIQKKNIIAG
jgi:heptosyltransferase-2